MTANKQYDSSIDGIDKNESQQDTNIAAKNYDSSIDGIDKKDDSLSQPQEERIDQPAQAEEADGRGE
ncbi:hypothetical protein [Macrococcus carouselicus]|uniref:Uncharacterized protein n=1 Tax=Macrococcus carouselicus TaxID=69969 RepID=A0A9Q8CK60_9STAP|nr:hypothetical protein [Macrococcus carouselicus]TDM00806.1 hypothetical protein ERX40_08320 [Macrococcus carouselicus]